MTDAGRRVGRVVGGVVRQAVLDAGAQGVAILDDGSPEARLARDWCAAALGAKAVVAVPRPAPETVAALVHAIGIPHDVDPARAEAEAEVHRLAGRIEAAVRDALLVNPANKTALLLAGDVPPEPILPLGDLYASQVDALAGGWTAPPAVHTLAQLAGGIASLDEALARWAEDREPARTAFSNLDAQAAARLRQALDAGRHARRRIGIVPKLGARTLGIDLLA